MLYHILERCLLAAELLTGISCTPAMRLLLHLERWTCEAARYCNGQPWG